MLALVGENHSFAAETLDALAHARYYNRDFATTVSLGCNNGDASCFSARGEVLFLNPNPKEVSYEERCQVQ